jgi:uncharacterized protein YjbJ (UPF0337 family)
MMKMSENRIEGAARKEAGRVQGAVGALTGDTETEVRGKMNDVAGTVQNAYGKVQDKIQDGADEAFEAARGRAQALRGRLSEAADTVQSAYGTAISQADETFAEVQTRAEAALGEIKAYAREKPLMALGGAMVTGMLLWHMLGANRKVIYVRK